MAFNLNALRDVARATVGQPQDTASSKPNARISEGDYKAIAAQYAAARRGITPQQMESAKALLHPWIKNALAKNDEDAAAAALVDAVFREQSFEEYQNGLSRPSKRVDRVRDEKKDKQR